MEIKEKVYVESEYVLGTFITIKAYGENAEIGVKESIEKLKSIDDSMSAFKDESEVSLINKNSGLKFTKVSRETLFVIKKAIKYAKLSNGGFDITIRPVLDLWAKSKESGNLPKEGELTEAISLVNYKDIHFLFNYVKLSKKGQKIDLGGIAKGYAGDEVFKILKKHKISSAIIDLGGNILVLGKREDKFKWNVGIQNPFEERGQSVGVIEASDRAIVTSGDYERFITIENKNYHHFLDKNTGFPLTNNIKSVTIISEKSIDGDGLTSCCFALGVEKGLKLINSIKGVEVIFIDSFKQIYLSNSLKNKFKLLDGKFKLTLDYRR